MDSSNNISLLFMLVKLWGYISKQRRKQFYLLIALAVLSSFCEIISIGMVLPFLAAITNPQQFVSSQIGKNFIEIFPTVGSENMVLVITIVFCCAALISGFIRLSLLWATTRVSYSAGADLSIDIYRKTLYQPYSNHITRNSSEVISAISNKTNSIINNALYPILAITSSSILLVTILIALISLNPVVACGLFLGFGLIYIAIIKLTHRQLRMNSNAIASESTKVIKALQEGLGGIRDVLINGSQEAYCKIYQKSDLAFRKAQGSNQFIASSPRFFIEALGMVVIAIFAYSISARSVNTDTIIPLLGVMAVGAVRLLPILQQIFSSWTSLISGQASVKDTLSFLDQSLDPNFLIKPQPFKFSNSISLENVSFRHNQSNNIILKNISFSISRGEVIGFMGPSGSGKSTILDVVMGLIIPTNGVFKVDGVKISEINSRNWQQNIAHVPQNIFLSDASIAENIAFGIPLNLIDSSRLHNAIELAQLSDVISSLPNGFDTRVGERGVLLSGGQRQRLGIARALYKNSKVLILDEATSALDNETEREFMASLAGLSHKMTILMVAHRLSTLNVCDRIYKVVNGRIEAFGSYNELV